MQPLCFFITFFIPSTSHKEIVLCSIKRKKSSIYATAKKMVMERFDSRISPYLARLNQYTEKQIMYGTNYFHVNQC